MPKKLMRGIRHFKNNSFQEKQDVFRALSQGQNPDVLFITCSDSRIDPVLYPGSFKMLCFGRLDFCADEFEKDE